MVRAPVAVVPCLIFSIASTAYCFLTPARLSSSTWNGQDATGLRLNEPFLTTVIFILISLCSAGHVMCPASWSGLLLLGYDFLTPARLSSSTWNGQDATGLRLNEPFLTTVIFIVISCYAAYAALVTSCAQPVIGAMTS